MSPEITPSEIKALFRGLVKAVGTLDAAGAFLGVSHQRVHHLCALDNSDLPTLMQVVTLEQALGKSVVFAALADRVHGISKKTDPLKEAGDVLVAGADVFDAIRRGEPARVVTAKFAKLEREVSEAGQAIAAVDEGEGR